MEFGLSGAFVEMPNGASTGHFDFPWLQQWNALFYLNLGKRVNTILTHFPRLRPSREIGRRETTAARCGSVQWCENRR
jgi:hypothetical protein